MNHMLKNKIPDFATLDEAVKFWDTAGQERFKSITLTFYKKAKGIILVYDVTERQSFISVSQWAKSISENADAKIIKYLLGNKIDLVVDRKVDTKEGMDKAKELGMKFCEVSAKTKINIKEALQGICKEVYDMEAVSGEGITTIKDPKKKEPKDEQECCLIL